MSDYPIFDESYRKHLNKTIVDNYFFHEIGYETGEMFIHNLGTRMRLIMPPMNQLYETTLMDIDPLTTMRLRTTSESQRELKGESARDINQQTAQKSSGNGSSDSNTKSRAVSSEFPQTMLAENQDYATGATDTVSNSTSTTSSADSATSTTTGGHTQTENEQAEGKSDTLVEGFTGSVADLIIKYRNSIINVDQLIVDQLGDLFMSILNTGDAYTPAPMYGYPYPYFTGYGRIY